MSDNAGFPDDLELSLRKRLGALKEENFALRQQVERREREKGEAAKSFAKRLAMEIKQKNEFHQKCAEAVEHIQELERELAEARDYGEQQESLVRYADERRLHFKQEVERLRAALEFHVTSFNRLEDAQQARLDNPEGDDGYLTKAQCGMEEATADALKLLPHLARAEKGGEA